MSFTPVDEADRARARTDHGTSLVLEAGAGTGKTTLLIDRIEFLIRTGTTSLDKIAAVTFTENAATTMKLRLRECLEKARLRKELPEVERERVQWALESLERAQISTIHALCAAILQERPLECGVTPGFRTADEAEADILFAEAWEEWLASELSGGETVLLEALDHDIPLDAVFSRNERQSLRGFARALIEERDLEPIAEPAGPDPIALRRELQSQAEAARRLLSEVKPGDTLGGRLEVLVAFWEKAETLSGEELKDHLLCLEPIHHKGFKERWSSPEALEQARMIAQWTGDALRSWNSGAEAALHGRIVKALVGVGARYERRKTEEGVLDFMDLLLKARNALRDRPSVRTAVQRRFAYLLIDEFQDTDPIQVEIARLMAEDRPGSLVVVGDPKQSIYRFRRADVSLFRDLSREAQSRPGWAVLHLTQSFRSRAPILHFVNRTFSRLIKASDEAGQAPYEALTPPPGLPEEPCVVALRFGAPFDTIDDILRSEAQALARYLEGLAAGGFRVRDSGSGELRKSRAGDVMILARRLTQIRHLEEALEEAGIRFTVEGGKSFFDRVEVREAVAILRAIDDPSDRIAFVGALRSSFLGMSDRDIVSYSLSGGSLKLGPLDMEKPGAESLRPPIELLESLHALRTKVSVPRLIETLYDSTRILPALGGSRRGEAQVANLEKIVTLARHASALGILTLRGFVRFLQERIESAREEPDLPSTRPGDPETARILSIHKAKGLEAPIVALFDSADAASLGVDCIPFWSEGKVALGFRKNCQPRGWDAWVQAEKRKQDAENHRLLYVATTRARDLLVIPHPTGSRPGFWSPLLSAPLEGVLVQDVDEAPRVSPTDDSLRTLSLAKGGDPLAERWEEEREKTLRDGAFRSFVPIAALKVAARGAPPYVAKAPRAGGRHFGRLVHRVLELIDLGNPGSALPLAEAVAASLGQDQEAAQRAARLVQETLALPLLERARRAERLYRELPVVFPDGSDLVEGKVDLVFEEDGSLVVVDYKTDPIADAEAIAQAAHHAPQLQLYGRGLAQATGLGVRERVLVFVELGRTVQV
jgi:ATP-dependent helicase/nuclease subunit A